MSAISLNYHILGYSLSEYQALGCVITGLTAIPYALRHFAQAMRPDESTWAHVGIGILECIPVIGAIAALIECYLNRAGIFQELIAIPTNFPATHHTLQAQELVTEFGQLPIEEQTRVKDATHALLHTSVTPVELPQIHPATYESNFRWKYLRKLTETSTPASFIETFQSHAPDNIAWHQTSYDGDTVLHWAVRSGRVELINCVLNIPEGRALLNFGSNRVADTPLMTAVEARFVFAHANRAEIITLLLDAQANPNLADQMRITPLSVAAEQGSLPIITLLLQHSTATVQSLSPDAFIVICYVYRQIEKALKEGLDLIITHTDLHALIIDYYWARESTASLER